MSATKEDKDFIRAANKAGDSPDIDYLVGLMAEDNPLAERVRRSAALAFVYALDGMTQSQKDQCRRILDKDALQAYARWL